MKEGWEKKGNNGKLGRGEAKGSLRRAAARVGRRRVLPLVAGYCLSSSRSLSRLSLPACGDDSRECSELCVASSTADKKEKKKADFFFAPATRGRFLFLEPLSSVRVFFIVLSERSLTKKNTTRSRAHPQKGAPENISSLISLPPSLPPCEVPPVSPTAVNISRDDDKRRSGQRKRLLISHHPSRLQTKKTKKQKTNTAPFSSVLLQACVCVC